MASPKSTTRHSREPDAPRELASTIDAVLHQEQRLLHPLERRVQTLAVKAIMIF